MYSLACLPKSIYRDFLAGTLHPLHNGVGPWHTFAFDREAANFLSSPNGK